MDEEEEEGDGSVVVAEAEADDLVFLSSSFVFFIFTSPSLSTLTSSLLFCASFFVPLLVSDAGGAVVADGTAVDSGTADVVPGCSVGSDLTGSVVVAGATSVVDAAVLLLVVLAVLLAVLLLEVPFSVLTTAVAVTEGEEEVVVDNVCFPAALAAALEAALRAYISFFRFDLSAASALFFSC